MEGLTDEDELMICEVGVGNEDLSKTYVQYEVYDPKTFGPISLDICEGSRNISPSPVGSHCSFTLNLGHMERIICSVRLFLPFSISEIA